MMQEKELEELKNVDEEDLEEETEGSEEGKNRVCRLKYPKGFYKRQRFDGFYMHPLLKQQLDYYLINARNDWDFIIIISGEGGVRVGKSVLALQIAAYWIQQIKERYGIELPFSLEDNLVFDGVKLIEKGNKLGVKYKHSPLIFDEAGADLEGVKGMLAATRAVKDFLRECGQYNFLTILVLPEFFDLPRGIAVNRSNCLINVYWIADEDTGKFRRGYFKFYSIPNKRKLYLRGKKELNYSVAPYDFFGTFKQFYPLNEEEYRRRKIEALKKRESGSYDKKLHQRNIAWFLLNDKFGIPQSEIARMTTELGSYTIPQTIQKALDGLKLRGDYEGKKVKKI